MWERQPVDVSLAYGCFSPSLSVSLKIVSLKNDFPWGVAESKQNFGCIKFFQPLFPAQTLSREQFVNGQLLYLEQIFNIMLTICILIVTHFMVQ